jgi:uncharacterized protein YndB with AHSA1/START domain
MNDSPASREAIAPVVKSVFVPLAAEKAFHLFTREINRWWPLKSHSVGGENAVRCVLEERVGGRFYEVNRDSSQSDWGEVLAWDPPRRVSFTMHPGRDATCSQVVEVLFEAESSGTRVTLTHHNWEVLGTGAQAMRDGYAQGWDLIMNRFAAEAAAG